jgi:hypothetical protein
MTMIVSGLMLASINATVPLEPGPREAHTVELARTRTRARTLTRTHVERLTSGPSPPAMGCFLRGHYLLLAPCRSFLTSHFLDGGEDCTITLTRLEGLTSSHVTSAVTSAALGLHHTHERTGRQRHVDDTAPRGRPPPQDTATSLLNVLKQGPHGTVALMQARPRGGRLHDFWQQASKRGAAKEARVLAFAQKVRN